jgi:cysteine desulfurase family protein (TIGR01976 family)
MMARRLRATVEVRCLVLGVDSDTAGAATARPDLRATDSIRSAFPGLLDGVVPLDGAAGTLMPDEVIDAVTDALRFSMANVGGAFDASVRSGEAMLGARRAIADLVGGAEQGVVFGPNMTTLTFRLADTLASAWGPGDEVVVTALDHDANVRPWVLAAERSGALARFAEFDVATGELDPDAFDGVIGERTRLVAVTAASNAIGSRPDVRAIADRAHAAGSLVYVDGVHSTPHVRTDMTALGADFYACSSYKFFGPHAGCVVADPGLLERLHPLKLAPSSDLVPARFEWGTPSFEQLAGVAASVDWISGLTGAAGSRRARLVAAFDAIEQRLGGLLTRIVSGLGAIDRVTLLGAPARRTSTVSFVVSGCTPREIARELARRGICVWDGDNYAFELMRRFGLSDTGAVRASLVIYNDESDVDALVDAVAEIASR